MTFLVGIMAVSAKREYIGTCSICCLRSKRQQAKRETETFAIASAQNRLNEMNIGNQPIFVRLIGLLLRPVPTLIVLICLIGTLIASIYGSMAIKQINLSTRKTFRDSDSLHSVYKLKERFFQLEAISAVVRVDNPPDFNNFTELESFLSMVHSLESSINANAQELTLLWLKPYLQYLSQIHTADFYEPLCDWLRVPTENRWLSDLQFFDDVELSKCSESLRIKRFSFQVSFSYFLSTMQKLWLLLNSSTLLSV